MRTRSRVRSAVQTLRELRMRDTELMGWAIRLLPLVARGESDME